MEEGSSSSSSNILLSRSPAIDRYNPIIKDSRRIAKSVPPCNTPQPPISPKPLKKKNKKISLKENIKKNDGFIKIKSEDEKKKDIDKNIVANISSVSKSWSCTKPGAFISPPGSTRYLLSEKVLFNGEPDFEPVVKSFPEENSELKAEKTDELLDQKPSSAFDSPDQVVVLRVSLHCRGCERKMRKHLARMEGVTSFNIDFMAKKVTVTVTGKVTPLAVLSSISKVKNATLWSPTISSSSSSNPSSSVLLKNEYKLADKEEGVFVSMAS